MKSLFVILGIVLIVIVSGFGTKLLFNYFSNQYTAADNQPIKNFTYDRDTMVKFCIDGAMAEKTVTFIEANTYCSCVVDDGLSIYGYDKFTNFMSDLGNTNIMPTEINGLVNKCLQKVNFQ